ncbi:EF-P lysine aminoacylase EpmA [Rubripirellula amarantea]|uniref:Elongation factor P--(R)-beta-lysine ligase n=1 Tax=Rubripirellula amarantea TaxID=2527999 RepID=A0A5C5WVA4_9BACT|nr:EF-P lysine aminoacylase EpmA [Rubripirellula amarantea]MDA8745392.1 EF-P lysine aminoacylase EpmA [Rubripirellula amarantea]TWT53752.1 Elongation factor P--(R)-beta-lysine ligase [Rubripirellula amarantea]
MTSKNTAENNNYPDMSHLRPRAELLRILRHFLDHRGFIEVQPPCLMSECIADPFIDPITIPANQIATASSRRVQQYYLQTSPELAMKRMLGRGSGSIYSLGPVFRGGEAGGQHNVEFTMLEWYEVGANLAGGVDTLRELAKEIFDAKECDVLNYREAFQLHLSLDPLDCPIEQLQSLVDRIDSSLVAKLGQDRDALLDVLLSERVQPHLGKQRPVVLKNYPLTQAALAKPSDDDPQCAARFELFCRGIEIANGYDELLDDSILLERCEKVNQQRIADGRSSLPLPKNLLQAMRDGLPPSAGVAMGVDRVMLVRSAIRDGVVPDISAVIPITIERA